MLYGTLKFSAACLFAAVGALIGGACATATREFGAGGEGGSGGAGGGGDAGVTCPPNLADCGGVCVDRTSDPANCGACAKACAEGEVCVNTACVCGPDWTVCGSSCVDTMVDLAHCGGCDNACSGG